MINRETKHSENKEEFNENTAILHKQLKHEMSQSLSCRTASFVAQKSKTLCNC